MDTCWRMVIRVMLVALLPLRSIAVFSGPSDTTVLLGGTATLRCSFPEYTGPGVTQWGKDGTTIASEGGIFVPGDYPEFVVITSSSVPTTRLDLKIPNAQVSYEGSYECEMTPNPAAAARLTVEIQGAEPTIALTQPSTGSLMEGVEGNLTCTATGYRPAVNLLWFRNGNPIETGILETTSASGDTTDTTSIWTFTPTKDYNEDNIECRTNITGRISLSRTGSLPLNVRYAPVVTVVYSKEIITCSADSNPFATSYQIILNKTQVVKQETTNGGSYLFTPDSCTYISCKMTNTIGTSEEEVDSNPICPGYVDPTTTPSMTTDKNGGPNPTVKPGKQSLEPVFIALIAVSVIIVIAVVVIVLGICYYKRLFCFGSNNTKTETSAASKPPKKQPSVSNTDMIRNQPEVRQSVHKYEDEPKKPRVARANDSGSKDVGKRPPSPQAGKRPPSPQAGRPNVPSNASNDHRQGYPKDMQDGNAQFGGMNYADLEFQDRGRNGNGHTRPANPPPEEPTQYASILV